MSVAMMASCNSSGIEEINKLSARDSITIDMTLPTIMELHKNNLLIGDVLTDGEICTLYNIDKKQIIAKFGTKGHGNEEFMHLSSLQFSEENDTLYSYAYDPVNKIMRKYDLSGSSVRQVNKIKDNGNVPFTQLLKIKNGFLATGCFAEGKFAMLDDSLKGVIKYEGDYLQNQSGDGDVLKNAVANHGVTVISSDKKHLTSIVYMASEIRFYDIVGNQLNKVGQHMIRPLNYECNGDAIVNKDVMGYLSATYGKQSVFALYSGLPEAKEGYATYGSEIHVFDFEGKLKTKYQIEHPALVICVDENEKHLYAMTHEPKPTIYIYDLNQ